MGETKYILVHGRRDSVLIAVRQVNIPEGILFEGEAEHEGERHNFRIIQRLWEELIEALGEIRFTSDTMSPDLRQIVRRTLCHTGVNILQMAKSKKIKEPAKRGKYDEKLAVNGTFKDLMLAAAKDAKKKSAPKKS